MKHSNFRWCTSGPDTILLSFFFFGELFRQHDETVFFIATLAYGWIKFIFPLAQSSHMFMNLWIIYLIFVFWIKFLLVFFRAGVFWSSFIQLHSLVEKRRAQQQNLFDERIKHGSCLLRIILNSSSFTVDFNKIASYFPRLHSLKVHYSFKALQARLSLRLLILQVSPYNLMS